MNINKLINILFLSILLSIGIYGSPLSASPADLVRLAIPNAKADPQIPLQYRISLPEGGVAILMIHEDTDSLRFQARFERISNREGAIAAAAHLLNTLGLWKLNREPQMVSSSIENSVTIDWTTSITCKLKRP